MRWSPTVSFKAFVLLGSAYLFWKAEDAYLPILLSLLAAFVLHPLVQGLAAVRLGRFRVGKTSAILLAFFIAAAAFFLLIGVILTPVVEELQKLYKNIPQMLTAIQEFLFLLQEHVLTPIVQSGILAEQSERFFALLQQAVTSGATFSFQVVKNVANTSFGVISRGIEFVVVPVLSFYFLKDWRQMTDWVVGLFSIGQRKKARDVLSDMGVVISEYLRGQVLLCLIIGAISFVGYSQLKIGYPFVLAILAGIMEAVPIVGPIFSAVPAILLGFAISPATGLKVLFFCFLLQQLENHIIVPKVMGGSIHLHPSIVIVSLLIGGQFLGIIGMMLAIPITALGNVLMRHFWITEE